MTLTISEVTKDIQFIDAFTRLNIRGLDFKKLVNFALVIYNNEGYNVDQFTLRLFMREFIDTHSVNYLISRPELKPQMRDLETVIKCLLRLFFNYEVPIFEQSECYLFTTSTIYIKGVN